MTKHAAALLCLVLLALLLPAGRLAAQGLDDMFDEKRDDQIKLDAEDRISADEVRARVKKAVAEAEPSKKRKALPAALKLVARRGDVVFQPREWNAFVDELLDNVPPRDLRPFVRELLKLKDKMAFDPSAKTRFNLGIRLSLVAGGASFDELVDILKTQATQVEMEWILPVIGRAGGAKALPILRRYRNDKSIIPLSNYQNIRPAACAAVLGCAYAGDQAAFDKILAWYDRDFIDRPRFAFYVAWSIQEGMKPSYVLVDYCQHRIRQAERLLNAQGPKLVPSLIERANDELLVAMPDYLLRRLARAPREELPLYLGLLDHPSIMVKQRVLDIFLTRGDDGVKAQTMAKVRALLKSERGLDRFFAVRTLRMLAPDRDRAMLDRAVENEPNPAVRYRLAHP